MDLGLSSEEAKLVERCRWLALERLAPLARQIDRGEAMLSPVLEDVRQTCRPIDSALGLVLACEALAMGSAAAALAFGLSSAIDRFAPGAFHDIPLVRIIGVQDLVNAFAEQPMACSRRPLAISPVGATVAIRVTSDEDGLAIWNVPVAAELPSTERMLSGLRALRVSVWPDDALPTGEALHFDSPLRLLGWSGLAYAAVCLGLASQAVFECHKHLKNRIRMPENQPLGHFQGLRFMAADVSTQLEGARWSLYEVAWSHDRSASVDREALDEVRMLCGKAALDASNVALRLAGGAGFTPERPFERLVRDAWALEALAGLNVLRRNATTARFPDQSESSQREEEIWSS